jgi:hypothetical protein
MRDMPSQVMIKIPDPPGMVIKIDFLKRNKSEKLLSYLRCWSGPADHLSFTFQQHILQIQEDPADRAKTRKVIADCIKQVIHFPSSCYA